jgi:hypothetical protein
MKNPHARDVEDRRHRRARSSGRAARRGRRAQCPRHWPWTAITFWWLLGFSALILAMNLRDLTSPEGASTVHDTLFLTVPSIAIAVWIRLRPVTARWWAVAWMGIIAVSTTAYAWGQMTLPEHLFALPSATCAAGLSCLPTPHS